MFMDVWIWYWITWMINCLSQCTGVFANEESLDIKTKKKTLNFSDTQQDLMFLVKHWLVYAALQINCHMNQTRNTQPPNVMHHFGFCLKYRFNFSVTLLDEKNACNCCRLSPAFCTCTKKAKKRGKVKARQNSWQNSVYSRWPIQSVGRNYLNRLALSRTITRLCVSFPL